jgi:hypothetical protein
MEKDIQHTQDQNLESKKDIQVYEAVSNLIKDKKGIHLYRRSLKICKAYFLLTQHMQGFDSIKSKLQNSALDMSSRTLDLVTSFNKTEESARAVAMNAMALVSMSDIAVTSRLFSDSNYTLVVGQVQIFIDEVEQYWNTMSHNNQVIPMHMFDVDALDDSYKKAEADAGVAMSFMNTKNEEIKTSSNTIKKGGSERGEDSHIGHVKMNPSQTNGTDASTTRIVKSSVIATLQKSAHKFESHHSQYNQNSVVSVDGSSRTEGPKNDRQTLILNTIHTKGESSIKDLTDIIKGCSEKTIQRELITLVHSGALLKTGERRWSRYSIAQ